MFSKIINKIKSKNDDTDKKKLELIEKIASMNLTDMRSYVKNKIQGFEVTTEGLQEVLKKLTAINEDTSKRYLELDDMDSKVKKAFELVLSIASDNKINIDSVELIQEFTNLYSDIIAKYDTENKQIYGSKLKNSIENAILTVNARLEFNQKHSVLNK